jgi:uncharacterized protein (TIGR03435 family)
MWLARGGTRRVTVILAVATLVVSLRAASQAQSTAAFEVASIKPNAALDQTGRVMVSPGMFRATNVNARSLVLLAYGVDGRSLLQQQLVGGPDWMESERFNVIGRMAGDVRALRDITPLVRQLLEDRFQLRARRERRRLHVYGLSSAGNDGRAAPSLRESALDCSNPTVRARALEPPTNGAPWCGSRFGNGDIRAGGYTMASLTYSLSSVLKAIVVNETGLAGTFDFELQWNDDPAAVASDKPSIFTAVQEQLGLKLVSKEAEVDVVVIDSIERPSPD